MFNGTKFAVPKHSFLELILRQGLHRVVVQTRIKYKNFILKACSFFGIYILSWILQRKPYMTTIFYFRLFVLTIIVARTLRHSFLMNIVNVSIVARGLESLAIQVVDHYLSWSSNAIFGLNNALQNQMQFVPTKDIKTAQILVVFNLNLRLWCHGSSRQSNEFSGKKKQKEVTIILWWVETFESKCQNCTTIVVDKHAPALILHLKVLLNNSKYNSVETWSFYRNWIGQWAILVTTNIFEVNY